MEYNYYPAQSGHPPPGMANHIQSGPQQMPPQPHPNGPNNQIVHAPMLSQGARQSMPPGPQSHHQTMQQQHHLSQHPQQHQQQHHPNYHLPQQSSNQSPQMLHTSSPQHHLIHQHPPHQQQHQHMNHQPNLPGPMHPQSPHHNGGPPIHLQHQQQINRPNMGIQTVNHMQLGHQHHHPQHQQQQQQPPPPPPHHQQNFFTGPNPNSGAMQPHINQQYLQHNQHHPHHHQLPPQPPIQHHHPQQSHPHHPANQGLHHQHQPHMIHHHPPFHHQQQSQPGIGRNSPHYQGILQTEMRIIEFNRRLQSRLLARKHPDYGHSFSGHYDESIWWDKLIAEFFDDDATLTIHLLNDLYGGRTIGRLSIARFFRNYLMDGTVDLSISLRNPRETFIQPTNIISLICDQAFLITTHNLRHGNQTHNSGLVIYTEGHLTIDFVSNNFDPLLVKSWRFITRGYREYIDKNLLHAVHVETTPMTPHGITKSAYDYLSICDTIESMQELFSLQKVLKLPPRDCLKKYLKDKGKIRDIDDQRGVTSKRRKRKTSAAPNATGSNTNKKSKANANNNNMVTNLGLNSIMMSPSGAPGFALASHDVMIVGEPSMMGGDFGDDNERMITRLENTQYEPSISGPPAATNQDPGQNNNNDCSNNDNTTISSIDNSTNNINQDGQDSSFLQERSCEVTSIPVSIDTSILSPQVIQQDLQTDPNDQHQEQHQQQQPNVNEHDQVEQHDCPDQINGPQHVLHQEQTEIADTVPQLDGLKQSFQSNDDLNDADGNDKQVARPFDQVDQGSSEDQPHNHLDTPNDFCHNQEGSTINETFVEAEVEQNSDKQHVAAQLNEDIIINEVKLEDTSDDHQEPPSDSSQNSSQDQSAQTQNSVHENHLHDENEIKIKSKFNDPDGGANNNSVSNDGLVDQNDTKDRTLGVDSIDSMESHINNSIQNMNEESNSNSQLPCSTAPTNPTIEQQQPVNNGVA